MAAPVCSSWVWINRATNKRSGDPIIAYIASSREKPVISAGLVCPLGDTSNINVSQANKMVSRS